jgi:hemoglobin
MEIPIQVHPRQVYEAIGGDPTFRRLVEAFYRRIEGDPLLRPLFPADLAVGKEKQFLFLAQYFGGPDRYTERYGHPRLRMRHLPFPIGQAERDAWLGHMLAAIEEVGIREPYASVMRDYFERASAFMINRAQPEEWSGA